MTAELTFSGLNGLQYGRFIHEIRVRAHKSGKSGDTEWMIGLASASLTGDALRWHVSLDPSIQNNWALLQRAMLEHYYDPASRPGEAAMIPRTAAAPPFGTGSMRYTVVHHHLTAETGAEEEPSHIRKPGTGSVIVTFKRNHETLTKPLPVSLITPVSQFLDDLTRKEGQ